MRYQLTPKQIERFWSSVDRGGGPDACWPWMRCKRSADPTDYGVFVIHGENEAAHRIAYSLVYGEILNLILHTCDNRPCCNPAHLYDGTHQDNVLDMDTRGRRRPATAKSKRARGQENGNNKLTEDQVREMRLRYANGERLTPLAKAYGLDRTQVWNIVTRRQWKHVL